jgi:hypothetical protein
MYHEKSGNPIAEGKFGNDTISSPGCQIFLGTTNEKEEKYQNGHKNTK